jgi:hypothetical protein
MNWVNDSNYSKLMKGKWKWTQLGGPRHFQGLNFNQGKTYDPMSMATEFLAPLSWTIYKGNKNKNLSQP